MEKREKQDKKEEMGVNKKQDDIQNKQLKQILIICAIAIISFLLGFAIVDSMKHFEYGGRGFETIKEGNLIFYKTSFPLYSSITGKYVVDYNIYLRNDPRELDKIPFDGKMNLNVPMKKAYIEFEEEFNCEGDGILAMDAIIRSFGLMGINVGKVIRDPELNCDEEGRYMYIILREGNKTSIEQYGPACYYININNCEILKGTEKFIVEAFVEFGDKKVYIGE